MSPAPNEIPKSYPGRHGDLHHHSTNLYDLDESTRGALVDEATGERYDNSTQRDEQFFGDGEESIGYVVDLEDLERGDSEEMDAAARWLAAHDRQGSTTQPPTQTPSDRELV